MRYPPGKREKNKPHDRSVEHGSKRNKSGEEDGDRGQSQFWKMHWRRSHRRDSVPPSQMPAMGRSRIV